MKTYKNIFLENYKYDPFYNNGKGKYLYIGLFVKWNHLKYEMRRIFAITAVLEISCSLLNLAAALQNVEINRYGIAAGLGVLSTIPWLLELYGVLRFENTKNYMTEMTRKSIYNAMYIGSLARGIILALMFCYSLLFIFQNHSGIRSIFVCIIYAVCAFECFVLFWLIRNLKFKTFENREGKPGKEI